MPNRSSQKETPQSFSREHSSYNTSNSPESNLCKSTYKTSFLSNELKQELLSVTDPQEREYRMSILSAIERKVEAHGTHQAQPHDNRARQFMPFAALKGYADMVQQEEDNH